MAAFLAVSRSFRNSGKEPLDRAASLPFALPIPSSRCLRNSLGRTSSCDSRTFTICSQKYAISSEDSHASRFSAAFCSRCLCSLCCSCALGISCFDESGNIELPLVAVVGPTASGKSALGVWLAEQFGGEVVACDSTQLYRGFDIGTAKPGLAERRGIPHHLIDVSNAQRRQRPLADTARWRWLCWMICGAAGALPILTVGTGLYLRALLEGLADVPQRSEELRERLRASAEDHTPGYLHRLLARLDPEAAGKIAPADEQKLIRAIEVCVLARRPLSEVHRTGRTPLEGWRALKIGLMPPREALYERIHARTDAMLAQGWMEEVRGLMESGLPENAKPFDFIGYRELREVLRGKKTLEEARGAIQQATRRYAKRQMTWFRKDPGVHWFTGFGDDPHIQREALEWLRQENLAESPQGS